MVTVNAAAALNGAGSFATSRRGGVSYDEIAMARSRLGARATVAQVAKMIGRCEADVRPLMECRNEVDAFILEQTRERQAEQRRHESAQARQQAIDDGFRRSWLDQVPVLDLAERHRMSPSGVRHWAKRLGLPPRAPESADIDWTPELDEIIRTDYVAKRMPAMVVAAMIPKATKSAVIGRAYRLGLCRANGLDRVAA